MGFWVLVQTQVLYNIGVPYCTEKATLLLKSSHESCFPRVIKLKQGGVKDFPSTRKVITHDLVDNSIGANTHAGFSFEELDFVISGPALAVPLLTPAHHEWTHKNICEYRFIISLHCW